MSDDRPGQAVDRRTTAWSTRAATGRAVGPTAATPLGPAARATEPRPRRLAALVTHDDLPVDHLEGAAGRVDRTLV
ncbi:hypothetical protein [Actinokineospora sp. NBRC 105648]|uniref:hypothetical protein n=1 Tax=Actinokineospora sp. NBRC 105648 TaxID=3032206 RepID=UPI0024A20DD2|nr:hypothetical protein [Actinokineospora sp. NBRC 105648]GLZ41532.1 hypothetical protein Acsp05_51560 [Actinokineospora sp. NBRC 105648]